MEWKYGRIDEDRNSPIQDMEFFINNTVGNQRHPRGVRPVSIDAVINARTTPAEVGSPDNIPIGRTSSGITGIELFPK